MQGQQLIRSMPFSFTGNATEFFKIWIVNVFLSIFTLGIYSAWAKVRTLRYFYGNTWLDGNSFSYLADPINILKGRVIAVLALVAYFFSWEIFPSLAFWFLALGVLLFPALLVMAMSFQMNNSAYRSIRFSYKKDFRKVYLTFLVPVLVILVLTWLGYSIIESLDFWEELDETEKQALKREDMLPSVFMFCVLPFLPYLDYLRTRIIVDHIRYGQSPAQFKGTGWNFYSIYLVAFIVSCGVAILFFFGMVAVMAMFGLAAGEGEEISEAALPVIIGFTIIFYGLSFILTAYLRAARTNMIFQNSFFGEDTFISRLKTLPIAWIYLSNALAIVFSLGLMIPWAQIRMARYVAENTEFESRSLDNVFATEDTKQSAVGEEVGEAFDLDIGL